ncbi:glycosyltransferase family 39 protein [Halorubrum ezzemoulense]|nr:glycosyltransferase family 39 protein [Halorubrum ezzemoulense]
MNIDSSPSIRSRLTKIKNNGSSIYEWVGIVLLSISYIVIYLPRMMEPYPSVYRRNVQRNMKYVADTLASGGNPYTPPYPDFYSTAGGNLHGVLGAPFNLIFDFPQSFRIGVVVMGWISLLVFYLILKKIGVRSYVSLFMTFACMVYPQYILFFSQGNPSAADIFFGLIAVYAYLRWRVNSVKYWLYLSSLSAGAATFSHFYSGVIVIGIISHYLFTRTYNREEFLRVNFIYFVGLLPALGLLATYKLVFVGQDPNSHYTSRLIINSFSEVYYTQTAYESGFSMYSLEFLRALLDQHGDKSPIFGYWWLTGAVGIIISLSRYLGAVEKSIWSLILYWIMSGLLIVVIIPGGAIYHDYYTWWLLMGVFAGLALSVETAFSIFEQKSSMKRNLLAIVIISLLLLIIIESTTAHWQGLLLADTDTILQAF